MLRRVDLAGTRIWTFRAALALGLLAAACAKQPQAVTAPPSPLAAVSGGAAGAGADGGAGGTASVATPPASQSLRDAAAKSQRKLGVALATWFFQEKAYAETAARHFDSLTAENEMKWYATEPEPGKFSFDGGDKLVSFAEANRMRVRGHALVWHNQLAPWVKGLKPKELRAAMIRHAETVVAHYKGRIAQWDVVNESVDEAGKLRANSPFTALGPSYLDEAFRAAHAADPSAALYYNDYDIEDYRTPKSEGAYQLVKRLKEAGVPIHGMGFQMHLEPRNWPTAEVMQQTLERFAALGLQIELTEIDVPLGELPGSLEEKLAKQAELTRGVIQACLAVPQCTGMTFWGLTDKHSWLATPEWAPRRGRGPHLALLFDENYQPKPMFTAVFEALSAGPALRPSGH
jgi:endo-1,4-beta-xylanase